MRTLVPKLHRDFSPDVQPKDTLRYALNAINETREGDRNYVSNEKGFEFVSELPSGYIPVGDVYTNNDSSIIISTNGTQTEFGKLDKNSKYTTLINTGCWPIDKCDRVDVTYRVREGCEDTIYFTDGSNSVGTINLTNLEQYYTDDYRTWLDGPQTPPFTGEKWDCGLFKLFRDVTTPCIENITVQERGGRIEPGSIQFAIQYVDIDGNSTHFVYSTNPERIYNDNFNVPYNQINGDVTEAFNPLFGTTTNKSIRFDVNNLDPDFTHYRIAVIKTTAGNGFVNQVLLSPVTPIEQTTFTFTGDTEGYELIPIETVRAPKPDIATAQHIEQLENRLVLANTTEKQIDWCKFQSFASKIRVRYHVKEIKDIDAEVKGNAKNPSGDFISYMGDEVYALGIVYEFGDGTLSRAFHIPGRPKNTDYFTCSFVDDSSPIASNNNNVGHLPPQSSYERWQVFNTARKNNRLMGYYQCSTVYPDIKDCDGNSVWGQDACGNDLVGTPIRHHRFPDRRLEPQYTLTPPDATGKVRLLGLEVDNISYPDPDIVGHYIVRVKRTEGTKTVIDKGFAAQLNQSTVPPVTPPKIGFVDLFSGGGPGGNTSYNYFISPKNQIENAAFSGDYFKIEGTFKSGGPVTNSQNYGGGPTTISGDSHFYNLQAPPSRVNIPIDSEMFLSSFTELLGTPISGAQINAQAVGNISASNGIAFYNTDDPFPIRAITTDLYYTSLKVQKEVYCNLDSLIYQFTHHCPFTNAAFNVVFGGDTYISRLHIVDMRASGLCAGFTDDCDYNYKFIENLWIESEINISLRHQTNDVCTQYYNYLQSIPDYLKNKYFDPLNNFTIIYPIQCSEGWYYNVDYSKENDVFKFLPLPTTFDCCSKCLGQFPNRVFYSQQSFQEEMTDNYRVFLPNNFRDIEAEHGEISNIFRLKNNLFIHTREALWQLPQNVQERVTDEIVSFIGTGDFFSIPPRKIMDSDTGKMGCQDKWATIKVGENVFFPDQIDGTVYLLGKGEITEGMDNWFSENLPQILSCQMEKLGVTQCCENDTSLIAAYDSRHERILLTKRDYEIKEDFWGGEATQVTRFQVGKLYYRNLTCSFFEINAVSGPIPVALGDPRYFCDKSWTLSYSLETNSWISFHSYIPKWYVYTKNHLYSFEDHRVWKHHKDGLWQNYYGKFYPHIIEVVSNSSPLPTRTWDHIEWIGEAKRLKKGTYMDDRFETFDRAWFYNNYQFSGELNLVKKNRTAAFNYMTDAIKKSAGNILVDRNERNFSVNDFRNMVVDYDEPLFDEQCVNFRGTDKNINSVAIDPLKQWYELDMIRGKYLVIRLIYESTETVQLITKYLIESEQISER